ncbi:MAG: hypothetical protein GY863_18165 [bacterium]|nr:hypothetical protein [bacterium]
MRTTEDRLFVANSTDSLQMRTTVMVYSLEDGRLVNKFGGPGVFRIQPAHGVFLFMQPDRFAVNSSGKVSIYNYNFELLQELEHGGDSFFYVPIGDNFIARQIYSENRINYYRLNLYDHELNIIKELCRKEFAGRAFTGDFSFEVYQDKVYVSGRTDDFHIEVFDKEGNLVNSITHDCSRVKVTQDQKDKHMSNLTNRPGWERYFKSRDEMEEYFRNLIKYPEYFPAIEGIHLSDDKIYVLTRLQVEGKREFWILDPDGNAIDKIMIPFKMRSENMQYPYSIRNNHLYQLILNEQTEKWELFSTRIQ